MKINIYITAMDDDDNYIQDQDGEDIEKILRLGGDIDDLAIVNVSGAACRMYGAVVEMVRDALDAEAEGAEQSAESK